MDAATAKAIGAALQTSVTRTEALAGGCVAEVYRAELGDGRTVVAKVDRSAAEAPGEGLDLEGWMLEYLRARSALPVPEVLLRSARLLILEYVAHDGRGDGGEHAAELLAALHGIAAERFGLERDTLIGALPQPNAPSERWIPFFRDRRLLAFGRLALEHGRLSTDSFARLERLASRLQEWLLEDSRPSLIHGDVWGGNVLVRSGRIAAFVDPAIYYAHPEIEIAFTTLFSTFGDSFYRRYQELRPLAPGFFEERCDIYNLYPLLVHTILFGGGYAASVDRIARRLVG